MTKKKKTTPKKKVSNPKKKSGKSCDKKACNKSKIITPPPVPKAVNFQVEMPTDHTILNKLRTIRDRVFASFGIGPQ